MRPNPVPLIAALLCLSLSLKAQVDSRYSLLLSSGSFIPKENISTEKINEFSRKAAKVSGKTFAVIQFEQIPSEQQQQQLRLDGIELLDYIPNYAYTAVITAMPGETLLRQVKARALIELTAQQKMQPELAAGNFPARAVKVAGTADVWISFPKSFSFTEVSNELRSRNLDILSSDLKAYRIIALRVAVQRLGELALLPCIEYVQAVPGEDVPLSFFWPNWGKDGMRVSLLNAPVSQGGKNLKGTGVVIGVGDDSDPQPHPDFTGRITSRAATGYYPPFGHGVHVSGIAAGAGIVNEVRTGFAPKASIVSQVFSNIFTNAPAYVSDYGMVITNNSYGNIVNDCTNFGTYDLYSRVLDQQAFDLPELQSIFAAGNSGHSICAPYPDSFRTVLSGYQSAKNVLSVGNARPSDRRIFSRSSRGPVRDGRLKPEIAGIGAFITAAGPYASYYFENTGTSMASPAIAGGMALLIEKYRLQNAGANPKNGLMKALVCNSGEDSGNPGPDYSFGFGVANFWRAVNMLENNRYSVGNISPGPAQTININVPAGTAELKVMLYWNDPPAAAVASQTLINNLDLEVVTPSATTVLPLILDIIPQNVKNAAVNGVDNINNIEQVLISNPAAGNHTIRIIPTNIAVNPSQEYFVVYDFIPTETNLITPVGGEAYLQGENVMVRWDSYGNPQNPFTLEYSIDNGSNWTTLRNNISGDRRQYFYTAPDPNEWFIVPAVTTDQALMRITRNSTALSGASLPFVIHDTLFTTLSAVQCEGYMSIDWTAVPGATGYEIMMLQGTEMVTVATVTSATLTYTFSGLSKDTTYWATARPLIGTSNSPGRRGIAVSRKPDSGTCAGSISDNDIKLDAIPAPVKSGRLLTSTALGNSEPVSIRIKNLDDNPTPGNITVTYILNGGSPVNETIINPAIAAGATYTHSFGTNIDISAAGNHTLQVSVSQAGDPVAANNSITKIFKQLNNPSITGIDYLVTPYIDNFDAAPAQSHNTDQVGLTGLDKYDFVNSTDTGRIRTFINTGMAYSGNRAITLDGFVINSGTTDSLTGTFNLATYNSSTDDIRLDFRYKNHGQGNNAANKVWVRGDDNQAWVEAYNLYTNQNPVDGSYKFTSSIEVSDFLFNVAPSQSFSTSFQVRWGQYGQQQAADNDGGAGYTFDNVRLYRVTDDIQMLSIDTPIVNSCGLTANTPVRITVRNSRNTLVNTVPVRFRVNGGGWTTENIASIAANASVQYTFTGTANLLAAGTYLIETQVVYPGDTYDVNDTTSVTITNTGPAIVVTNASPHLQDFETNNGSWYTLGSSSWEYGTPASYKIKRAASGSKAWKTRLAGNYNDDQMAYLYSPCYDISTMTNPTLSFSLALDLEDCGGVLCDGAYVEYSVNGITWTRLGANGQGTNWYNKTYTGNNLWSVVNYHRWHVATIPLSVITEPIAQLTQLRFRFAVTADPAVNREGVAIDDIHIYSNPNGIYDVTGTSPVVNQPAVSGSAWVDFIESGTSKLIASVNPNSQNMGSTDVQSYVHTGSVRISSLQYYHNRNITIKPTTVNLPDSATVRFYFLDTETETLINATGCSVCSKPTMAYELGVTKYSDGNDANEDGTLANNTTGIYSFITSAKTRIVPFDKGYYAEFKVKDFSEFWLNNGWLNGITPLPLKLLSFTAKKKNGNDVLLEWTTVEEQDVNRFEVEAAKGNADYQQNRFAMVGQLPSLGNSTGEQRYSLYDLENNKTGVWYYRLKMIDNDGRFTYSPVRPVSFSNDIPWQVYPNPSAGLFNLVLQENEGELLTVKLHDGTGRLVKEIKQSATGFVQKIPVDLHTANFAPGLYLLEVSAADRKQSFRIVKQ
ncbi:MAG: S8 family serine peptidase [Bacteroidota bacterium]